MGRRSGPLTEAVMVDLSYPFTGRWLVQNSPADRVPSHGTARFASAHAIDFVPVGDDGRTAPITVRTLLRPEPPDRFPGFGRAILSPADGEVVAALDTMVDHAAYRGIPSVGYALTQARRAEAGWTALAGNHVMIRAGDVVIALCHLQQGSGVVSVGQRVRVGDEIGRCGNSGNSTEPHVHVQAMTSADVERAASAPITFEGALPRNREVVHA